MLMASEDYCIARLLKKCKSYTHPLNVMYRYSGSSPNKAARQMIPSAELLLHLKEIDNPL